MVWAQVIGAALGAVGNYKAAKENKKAQEGAFQAGINAVTPRPVAGGLGSSSYTDEGGTVFGLNDKYQAEADYALADAAANKGWLSQYQEGGPTAAANTLYEQRAAPLRRQQEREKQLFEEQALARGMLQADPTDRAAARQTEAWGNVYGDVYNKSFMDVQDIIDRYRDRVSGSLNTAVGLENIPMSYAQFGADQGKAFSPVAQLGTEALSGAGTAAAEGTGQFFSGLGGDVAAGKFAIPRKSATAGTHTSFTPPKGGMIAGPIKGLLY